MACHPLDGKSIQSMGNHSCYYFVTMLAFNICSMCVVVVEFFFFVFWPTWTCWSTIILGKSRFFNSFEKLIMVCIRVAKRSSIRDVI